MTALSPLETLIERSDAPEIPLPLPLREVYGRLLLPLSPVPYVVANFVQTIDGIVALGSKEYPSGAARDAFADLRQRLGKGPQPLNVVVTASGRVDLDSAVFQQTDAPVMLVTSPAGEQRLKSQSPPSHLMVVAASEHSRLTPADILNAVSAGARAPIERILLEGGPNLMGQFLESGKVRELFLTVAPQVAGRDPAVERLSLVQGQLFAPHTPLWADLTSAKAAANYLFLRYTFPL
jgi:riboflavin biosynthesis pyrimidine reductase